jgi:hypothetical protein
MTNLNESGARTEVGPHNATGVAMVDPPEAERTALGKELKEEIAEARRKKLACFQKTRTGVIKKTVPAITTMATTTSTVTPNLTPEELVKFMDVAVARKYGNDLSLRGYIVPYIPSKLIYKARCCSKLISGVAGSV